MKSSPAIIFIILGAALFQTSTAWGRARFLGRDEMIRTSDIIAIVDVVKIHKINPALDCGTETITANVKQVIKGKAEKTILFLAPCFFPCAVTKIAAGPQLVFLKHNPKLNGGFVSDEGSNWNYSYRPIRGTTVEWFLNSKDLRMGSRSLKETITEIQIVMSANQREKSREGAPN